MSYKRLNDFKLIEEYCDKPYNKECPKCPCYNDEFQCRYWKQVWENSEGERKLRIGNHWFNEMKMERHIIYQDTEITVGEDGVLHNPNKKPLTDIIYIMAKQIKDLKEENKKLRGNVMKSCPVCGEEFLTPLGCELYEQLQDKQGIINKATELIRELKELVDG